jgi:septum formation protein
LARDLTPDFAPERPRSHLSAPPPSCSNRTRLAVAWYIAPVRLDGSRTLILGSQSPRRKEILGRLGIPFVVRPADVDETPRAGESPGVYLQRIVSAKMAAVCAVVPASSAVLVADTVVIAPDGGILGKPTDDEDARSMLARLAGATHEVATRFALAEASPASPSTTLAHAQTVATRVTFRSLSRSEIADYVAGGEGRDKAGGYAVQGIAAAFVERIDGSFTSVVGLPLSEVCVALHALGWLGA